MRTAKTYSRVFFREIAMFSLTKEDLEKFKQLRIVVRIGSDIDNIDHKVSRHVLLVFYLLIMYTFIFFNVKKGHFNERGSGKVQTA